MPCNTITKVKLNLKGANINWLKDALVKLGKKNIWVSNSKESMTWNDKEGFSESYNAVKGTLTVFREESGNEILKAYSAEIVNFIGASFEWEMTQTGDNEYELQKGGY